MGAVDYPTQVRNRTRPLPCFELWEMWSVIRLNMEKMDVQPPPIRTLDDFVLGSAQFAVPDIRNLERWNNRIINNLLYYQSNYFVSFLTILGIVG